MNLELEHQISTVRFDSAWADEKPGGDLGVGESFGHELQDGSFPTAEVFIKVG
jgi:hypothetical protein